jgi:hypothetical protein
MTGKRKIAASISNSTCILYACSCEHCGFWGGIPERSHIQSNFAKRDRLKREKAFKLEVVSVRSGSFHRQDLESLAGSSCKRELYAFFFPRSLNIVDEAWYHFFLLYSFSLSFLSLPLFSRSLSPTCFLNQPNLAAKDREYPLLSFSPTIGPTGPGKNEICKLCVRKTNFGAFCAHNIVPISIAKPQKICQRSPDAPRKIRASFRPPRDLRTRTRH